MKTYRIEMIDDDTGEWSDSLPGLEEAGGLREETAYAVMYGLALMWPTAELRAVDESHEGVVALVHRCEVCSTETK